MGRKSLEVNSLHGYKIEDLINLKNTTESKYARLVLTIITMRYYGHSNNEIIKNTGLSVPTIVGHIKNWNIQGIKAIKDHRGGSMSKLEPKIVDNLIYVTINKTPIDFEFTSNAWTCELLALYINKTFGIQVSYETIRRTLIANNLSYKRAQSKPTKNDKDEQEAFKKNLRDTRYFRIFI